MRVRSTARSAAQSRRARGAFFWQVGNDPVWSVGEHGPTWALVDQLLAPMDAAGVALYISGRDPFMQHLLPTAEFPSVDFAGIGNGAYANASMAASKPNTELVPNNTLSYVYGGGTGFMTASVGGAPGEASRSRQQKHIPAALRSVCVAK